MKELVFSDELDIQHSLFISEEVTALCHCVRNVPTLRGGGMLRHRSGVKNMVCFYD